MAVEAEDKDYNSEDELQNLEVQDDEKTEENEEEVAPPAAAGLLLQRQGRAAHRA